MRDCPKCGATLAADAVSCRYCGAGSAAPFADVELIDVGNNIIAVIKVLRTALDIGLKESKEMAELPKPTRFSLEGPRALKLVNDLVQAGARARLV